MTDKSNEWIGGIGLAIVAWLVMEVVAGFIHVWMMKKQAICPYMAARKEKD